MASAVINQVAVLTPKPGKVDEVSCHFVYQLKNLRFLYLPSLVVE
jgi:hypothetical protein